MSLSNNIRKVDVFNDPNIDNMGTFNRRELKNYLLYKNYSHENAPVRTWVEEYYRREFDKLPGEANVVQTPHRSPFMSSIPFYYRSQGKPIRFGVRTPAGFRKTKPEDLQIIITNPQEYNY